MSTTAVSGWFEPAPATLIRPLRMPTASRAFRVPSGELR